MRSNPSGPYGAKKKKLTYTAYSLAGVKEMIIDFVCREDLLSTTLKEFFEIFIASIKKEQMFHRELLGAQYNYIGLALNFNNNG